MDHTVVYNTILTPQFREDFQHGLKMVSSFQPNPEVCVVSVCFHLTIRNACFTWHVLVTFCGFQVVQLLGHCGDVFITEYHKFGTADNLVPLLETKLSEHNTLATRFGFCVQYAKLIAFFHSGPLGTRVMCDSNDLHKTLSQYLVTSDLWLVANDLDALPRVNRTEGLLIKCGHRELSGDFVAPEQRWQLDNMPFDDSIMPGYDEKTDIWKIPDVCDHFLGDVTGADNLRFHLFGVHKQCKQIDPGLRPTAEDVVMKYLRVPENFQFE